MTGRAPEMPTLTEVAVVAGTPRATARAAATEGVLHENDLTWVDALVLRAYATVLSMRFPGEAGVRVREAAGARATVAVTTVREEVATDSLSMAALLVVTREHVKLAPSMGHVVVYLDQDLGGVEAAQVLPIGRWWYEMRWRQGGQLPLEA